MLNYLNSEYDLWLENLKKEKGKVNKEKPHKLSKIWPGYDGVALTHYTLLKNTYGNNAFITIQLHHTTGDIFEIKPKISWYELIQKNFSFLNDKEQLELLYAEKISYSSSHIGTVIITFDKENNTLLEITI